MLTRIDTKVIDKAIALASERCIDFINIQKIEDIYYMEYQTGAINNSKKMIDILSDLEKFKYAMNTNTLSNFYLYYDIGKDELVSNCSVTVNKRSQNIIEVIQLLEASKLNIIKRIGPVKVLSNKKTITLTGKNVINALIDSLQESLDKFEGEKQS